MTRFISSGSPKFNYLSHNRVVKATHTLKRVCALIPFNVLTESNKEFPLKFLQNLKAEAFNSLRDVESKDLRFAASGAVANFEKAKRDLFDKLEKEAARVPAPEKHLLNITLLKMIDVKAGHENALTIQFILKDPSLNKPVTDIIHIPGSTVLAGLCIAYFFNEFLIETVKKRLEKQKTKET